MSEFVETLRKINPSAEGRSWIYLPYDQLTDQVGPLRQLAPGEAGIVLIETSWKAGRRPYHKQKLALVLANQRHFALEQARRGVAVDWRVSQEPYPEALRQVVAERGPLRLMRPAERELRVALEPLIEERQLVQEPHAGWLTTTEDFQRGSRGPPFRMDAFYRQVRQRTGILMEGGSPVGGRYSFDGENRLPWDGTPPAPVPPTFEIDPITAEVGALIEARFGHHPGRLRLDHLPVTLGHAEALWRWALRACMASFGPYEDAMSTQSRGLFHTRIAPLLNLHRLLPARVVEDVLSADIPLNSKEGFIRQVIGWREFVRHVHEATDGFRDLPEGPSSIREQPGDGGYSTWRGQPWSPTPSASDGGACPSTLGASQPIPPAYWGTPSGLTCLDTVIEALWEDGWTHHIPRLMVLANLATLLDLSPRDLTDWFWVAFVDAYDWVVEPNVLGMGTYGAGPIMTTKPYVSGANYLHKLSDYCASCPFHPKKTCPITDLYWAFLARHEPRLRHNPRMSLALGGLKRRSPQRREADRRVFEHLREALAAGRAVTVASVQEARLRSGR
ncbi:MAG: deoxyribodipyrimidine photolyase [Deltaproteobacteria bacterium]|nr:MAG: deoxyribodipyrimidine photolyase [Deltaproteobacteria bacterium]